MNGIWDIDPNQSPIDQYSLLHAGYGFVLGTSKVNPLIPLATSLFFEWFLEPHAKRVYPDMFPAPSQDSLQNRLWDTVFVMAGYYVGRISVE